MTFVPFAMERWQSTHEHRVRYNLSESGVHPMTVQEIEELGGTPLNLHSIRLGYGQSNGSDELREMIASLQGASEAQVVATSGGAEANFAAFWELAGQDRRPVAAITPNYMQIPGLARNFQGRLYSVPLVEARSWRPDLDVLEDALNQGARLILATHPNNPTGKALSQDEVDAITALAARTGAWIIADEVYRGAELGDEESPSFWGEYERTVIVNSLSKAYGVPGLRLGWAIASRELAARLWARRDYITIAPGTISDRLARVVLSDQARPRILERTRGILRENLVTLRRWAEASNGLFSLALPDSGAIAMVRYDARIPSLELAERLRVQESLLIVPGAHFGIEQTARIGYGPPADELSEGLRRLERGLRRANEETSGR